MNELGIYVFSGTGNTLKCAEKLKSDLDALGVASTLRKIGDGSERAAEKDLILCYPVHGFNPPGCMIKFCRGLSGGGRVWFLKTSGEPLALNDASSAELIKILKKKGFSLMGEFHFVMPYNMVFRHSDEMASLMWKTAQERIPSAARQIAEGSGKMKKPAFYARAVSWACRIEHWFYPKNGRLFKVDEKRCTGCMKCVNNCPTGNIKHGEGRFVFGKSCICCARCFFQCPADAIRIGIVDFMRVNGPYDFSRDPEKAVIGKYCKKSYERYFEKDCERSSDPAADEKTED